MPLRVVAGVVAVLVVIFGTRQILGAGFPYVGQLLPLPSAGSLLHRFLSGWQPSGVGTTDPTSPATAILGVAGMILFGGVGLLQKILVLGCIPVGALGMARLVRPVGSPRARLASTLVYVAVPLPYDALATGRWDALLAYAASPWIVGFLARASGFAPFGPVDEGGGGRSGTPLVGRRLGDRRHFVRARVEGIGGGTVRAGGRGAHGDVPGRRVETACLPCAWIRRGGSPLAVITARPDARSRRPRRPPDSAAPSGAFLVLVIATGLAVGSIVTGGGRALRPAGRIVATALGATVVAFVLLMPWSVALLAGPDRWQALTGLATSTSAAPSWGAILRLALGPIGNSPLSWAFLASAGLPLVIGSRWRLAWAGRAWIMAIVAWTLAWAAGHGWLGPVTPSAQVLLAPAAVAVALGVGLGAASFESDLPGYRFGWRQAATVLAAVAAAVGMLPVLFASSNGRWDLPVSGYGQATSWMAAHTAAGRFRVLWLGDPRVLPGGGWQLSPGLAYSISEGGLGDATEMWPGTSPGPAAKIGDEVGLARSGSTVRLGTLLAPDAIRYVVVVDDLAPSIPGLQSPVGYQPPPELEPALLAQLDLRQIIGQGGFDVFIDDAALPERAVLTGAPSAPVPRLRQAPARRPRPHRPLPRLQPPRRRPPARPCRHEGRTLAGGGDTALKGWTAVLPGSPGATQFSGRVPTGTVLAAVAPSDAWELVRPGGAVERSHTIFGYAASFDVARPGRVTLRFRGSWVHGLEIGVEFLLWLLAVGALVGRRRSLVRLWLRLRRRLARRPRPSPSAAPTTDGEGGSHQAVPAGTSGGSAPR